MVDYSFVEFRPGQPPDNGPCWLLTHIAAKRLSLKVRTVRHLAQKGVLKGQKRGKKLWEFREDVVEAIRVVREARHAE
jgi:hypothetical protein